MQAVILAAGKGARLRPFTYTTPKPLLKVDGKNLIEHTLNVLPDSIDEIYIVVNHLREQIIKSVGMSRNGVPIKYFVQEPLNGTAGAILMLREHLHGSFLVMNSDDLFAANDLTKLVSRPWALLYFPDKTKKQAGALVRDGRFTGLGPSPNAVCGAYVLGQAFFEEKPVEIQVSKYHEFGLPQTLARMVSHQSISAFKASSWQPVGTPEQLKAAQSKK